MPASELVINKNGCLQWHVQLSPSKNENFSFFFWRTTLLLLHFASLYKKVLLRDRKRRIAWGVSCPWCVVFWAEGRGTAVLGGGEGYHCPGRREGVPLSWAEGRGTTVLGGGEGYHCPGWRGGVPLSWAEGRGTTVLGGGEGYHCPGPASGGESPVLVLSGGVSCPGSVWGDTLSWFCLGGYPVLVLFGGIPCPGSVMGDTLSGFCLGGGNPLSWFCFGGGKMIPVLGDWGTLLWESIS